MPTTRPLVLPRHAGLPKSQLIWPVCYCEKCQANERVYQQFNLLVAVELYPEMAVYSKLVS